MAAYSVVVSNSQGSVVSSNALACRVAVAGWGRMIMARRNIPCLTNVTGIAAGFPQSALRGDGTVTLGRGAPRTQESFPIMGQSLVPDG